MSCIAHTREALLHVLHELHCAHMRGAVHMLHEFAPEQEKQAPPLHSLCQVPGDP